VKRQKRILVIDGAPASRESLKEALEKEGYEVETSSDGVDTLHKGQGDLLPDLIITETIMPQPRLDALQLIRTLKAYDDTKHIRIIICSSKTSQEDIEKGLAAGADQYVTKPFQLPDIVARVKALLGDDATGKAYEADIGQKEPGSAKKSWIDFRRRMAEVSEDKRRYPRLEFHCPVRVEGVKGVSRVTDISMGGVFVEHKQPSSFTIGQTIHLVMKVPTEYEPVKVRAKVVNVRDRGIGFKFVDLTRRNQEVIRFCFNTFKDTIPLM
jgi:DNA-binding response OmpR family regulator